MQKLSTVNSAERLLRLVYSSYSVHWPEVLLSVLAVNDNNCLAYSMPEWHKCYFNSYKAVKSQLSKSFHFLSSFWEIFAWRQPQTKPARGLQGKRCQ